jgi:hypothetical protein
MVGLLMGTDSAFMMQEVLDFLNSIEGSGYGGMASFEIVRGYVRTLALPAAALAAPQRSVRDRGNYEDRIATNS